MGTLEFIVEVRDDTKYDVALTAICSKYPITAKGHYGSDLDSNIQKAIKNYFGLDAPFSITIE